MICRMCACAQGLGSQLDKAGCAGAEAVIPVCSNGAEAALADLQPEQCLPFD